MVQLTFRERLPLLVQREVGRLVSPLSVPAIVGFLRFGRRWRIEGHRAIRAEFRRIRRTHRGPLLVCANHLTRVDSLLVGWALGSVPRLVLRFSWVPWNIAERTNYEGSWGRRLLLYVFKTLPVLRGGDRAAVKAVLDRYAWLLARGEVGLLFPEGGRSRTGRVQVENAAYGVGRILGDLPGAKVLCLYMRGHGQDSFSDMPARGDQFHVELELLDPKTEATGLRAARDVSVQIVTKLAEMEARYLDGRQ